MILVIGAGAAFRTAQLRKGGPAVAELVGGVRVRSDTSDPAERRLLNVVEEMSIAAGMPVPAVYVLSGETSINAFAAGHTIHDAAVAVTRGTLESLTRDELQGVVAHEFSHILNGDMRLNLRLMGLLFGILLLTIIGRGLVRTAGSGRRRGRDGVQVVLVGVVLILLGYLGVFFGRLIQAAVSRQREYLADASAVQFTRNPSGIAGALKKIGGWRGSGIRDAHAEEVGHFFFADGIHGALAGALATHPPLEERIRRIDPSWDGSFLDASADSRLAGEMERAEAAPATQPPVGYRAVPMGSGLATVAAFRGSFGTVDPEHVAYARRLVDRIPPWIREAAHTPTGASDLACALLLADEAGVRERQLESVGTSLGEGRIESIVSVWEALLPLGPEAKLPLLDLSLPALGELSAGEAAALQIVVPRLIRADGRVLPFEFALFHVLRRHLPAPGRPGPGRRRGHLSLERVRREAQIVLSAVAKAGTIPEIGARGAEELDLDDVDEALERLALASPAARKEILEAAIESALGDGQLHHAEVEVVRAIAEALDVPLPPLAGRGTGAGYPT
jgi:Zn-dependent protease with chaperone function